MERTRTLIPNRNVVTVTSFVGTRRFVVPGDRGEFLVGDVGGEIVAVEHGVPPRKARGASLPFIPAVLWGVDHEQLLASDRRTAVLLRYGPHAFETVARWTVPCADSEVGGLMALAADRRGAVAVVGAGGAVARLWADCTTTVAYTLENPTWALAVAPDGSFVVTGRQDGQLEIRDPDTLEIERMYKPGSALALSVSVSPDGERVAFSDDAWSAYIVERATGAIQILPTTGKVSGLYWLSNSKVVMVNLSRVIMVWEDGKVLWERSLPELGDRYIQGSALIGKDEGLVLASEQCGLVYCGLGMEPGASIA